MGNITPAAPPLSNSQMPVFADGQLFNLTIWIQAAYRIYVQENLELFGYDVVQQFMSQPECNVSTVLNETADAKYTALCWPYAWVIRFVWGFIGSSVLILLVLAAAFGQIIFKAIVEDSGTYAGWVDSIAESNKENDTKLTFP